MNLPIEKALPGLGRLISCCCCVKKLKAKQEETKQLLRQDSNAHKLVSILGLHFAQRKVASDMDIEIEDDPIQG